MSAVQSWKKPEPLITPSSPFPSFSPPSSPSTSSPSSSPSSRIPSRVQTYCEMVLANCCVVLGFYVYYQHTLNENEPGCRTPLPSTSTWASLPIIELLLGLVLAASFAANLVYKFLAGPKYLCNMFCGCHVTTLMYCITIFSTRPDFAAYLFNNLLYFTYNTVFALAVPDTNDCIYFFQKEVFWIQHVTLLVAPVVMLWTGRLPVYECESLYFLISAMSYAAIMHMDLQLLSSLLSGVNVNYLVEPPPNQTIIVGRWYRFRMTGLIIVIMVAMRFAFVWGVALMKGELGYLLSLLAPYHQ